MVFTRNLASAAFKRVYALAAITACLLTVASGGVWAQSLFADDPRLDAPVKYVSDGGTIGQAVADISAITKVPMIAGMNKDDWQCYDRRVVVYVADMKARDLMTELATVLKFTWTRSGEEGKWNYTLAQTKEQWDQEENLRKTGRDAKERVLRLKREAVLAELKAALGSSNKETLKNSSPWMYVLTTKSLGQAVIDFLNGCAPAAEAYTAGTSFSIPISSLPANVQDSVRKIAESYSTMMKGLGPPDDVVASLKDFDQFQVTVNRRTPVDLAYEVAMVDKSMVGKISVGNTAGWIDIPLFDPTTDIGRAFAKAILALTRANKDTVGDTLAADTLAAIKTMDAQRLRDEADVRASDLPAQLNLFPVAVPAARRPGDPPPRPPLAFAKASLPATLGALAKTTNFNIVSDFFIEPLPLYPKGKKSGQEHMTWISALYGKSIVRYGDVLRIADKAWFEKRQWDVPTVWLSFWAKCGNDNGGLTMPELVQMAGLRDEQIDHTLTFDPVMAGFGASEAAANREILRFIGKLTDAQRKTLTTTPIMVEELSPEQKTALTEALAYRGGMAAALKADKPDVRLWVKDEGEFISYHVGYYPAEGKAPVEFRIEGGLTVLPDNEPGPRSRQRE